MPSRDHYAALLRYNDLQTQRAKRPLRVPVRQAQHEESMRLAPERQHLMNLFKRIGYQAESDVFAQIHSHYRGALYQVRPLIQSALTGTADLEVMAEDLRERLHPLSSPHHTRASAALCAELYTSPARYPGSGLRLHFSIAEPQK